MHMEGPMPVKHPAENTADHTKEGANNAKEGAENGSEYSPNNSKYSADHADDYGKGDDDQND